MLSIFTLLMVLFFSILITRIASVALAHTGLSKESAKFQARSAFTGVGFTTSESEKVVNHPIRRRILLFLMLLGNAGIVTAVSTLIISFVNIETTVSIAWRVGLLITGVVILWALASSKWIERHLANMISKALGKYTTLNVKDYQGMLHLAGEYQVYEMQVEESDWIANRALKDIHLMDEGIMILGITRKDGTYIGAPMGDTMIESNDTLILYGRTKAVEKLDQRKTGLDGELEHMRSIVEHKEVQEEEVQKDRAENTDGKMDAAEKAEAENSEDTQDKKGHDG